MTLLGLRLSSADFRWVPLSSDASEPLCLEATLPKTLEATFARSTRPLEATPGRFWLAFGATGTSKTDEFLKENNDFHFCVFSAPNPLSEPQKASRDVPKAPQDAPQGLSGAPKSLSEMLWKHPRASLRRPAEAAPEGSVRPRADEATNDTFFEATVERGHKETRDHSQTISQTKHASKPQWNEATQLMY